MALAATKWLIAISNIKEQNGWLWLILLKKAKFKSHKDKLIWH